MHALLQALANPETDVEYPLPEEKPITYTNVDVVVLPRGYMGRVKQDQEGRYRFAAGGPLRGGMHHLSGDPGEQRLRFVRNKPL